MNSKLETAAEPMLELFRFDTLPENQKVIASVYWDSAHSICALAAPSKHRSHALEKLLESRDVCLNSSI